MMMSESRESESSAAKLSEGFEAAEQVSPTEPEFSLEDLKLLLNKHVTLMKNFSSIEQVQAESVQRFNNAVKELSFQVESAIDKSSEVTETLTCSETSELDQSSQIRENFESRIKQVIEKSELYDKNSLKNAVKDMIGNVLNVGIETFTNHEFKVKKSF